MKFHMNDSTKCYIEMTTQHLENEFKNIDVTKLKLLFYRNMYNIQYN